MPAGWSIVVEIGSIYHGYHGDGVRVVKKVKQTTVALSYNRWCNLRQKPVSPEPTFKARGSLWRLFQSAHTLRDQYTFFKVQN
jgi:hypothetical protein